MYRRAPFLAIAILGRVRPALDVSATPSACARFNRLVVPATEAGTVRLQARR
jgi:hypothetical protein